VFSVSVVNRLFLAIHAEQNAQYAAPVGLVTQFQRTKGTGAFKVAKRSCSGGFRIPANPAEHFGPASSPVAGAAYCEAHCLMLPATARLKFGRGAQISNSPLADFFFIADIGGPVQLPANSFRGKFQRMLLKPHKYCTFRNYRNLGSASRAVGGTEFCASMGRAAASATTPDRAMVRDRQMKRGALLGMDSRSS